MPITVDFTRVQYFEEKWRFKKSMSRIGMHTSFPSNGAMAAQVLFAQARGAEA